MIKIKLVLSFMLIGSALTFVSCSSSRKVKSGEEITCNENLKFKKRFLDNIQNVENLIFEVQGESFKNSLKFISKYTHVSFERMMNYANSYPSGVFIEDKKVWLKWYEDNRCTNIQFK